MLTDPKQSKSDAVRERGVCLLIGGDYKRGDPAPQGYLQWHQWAKIQIRAGLRQHRCEFCGLWVFPQEECCQHSRGSRISEASTESRDGGSKGE